MIPLPPQFQLSSGHRRRRTAYVYRSSKGEYFLVLDGDIKDRLYNEPNSGWGGGPLWTWSQDGLHFACVVQSRTAHSSNPHVWLDDHLISQVIIGKDLHPYDFVEAIRNLRFSPDGKHLAFRGSHDGWKESCICNYHWDDLVLDGVVVASAECSGNISGPITWSADSSKLAFIFRGELVVVSSTESSGREMDFEGMKPKEVMEKEPDLYKLLDINKCSRVAFRFSPDGVFLLEHFSTSGGDVLVARMESGFHLFRCPRAEPNYSLNGRISVICKRLKRSFFFLYKLGECVCVDRTEDKTFDNILSGVSFNTQGNHYAYIAQVGRKQLLVIDGKPVTKVRRYVGGLRFDSEFLCSYQDSLVGECHYSIEQ